MRLWKRAGRLSSRSLLDLTSLWCYNSPIIYVSHLLALIGPRLTCTGRIESLARLNDKLSNILLNPTLVDQMSRACADLDCENIADQCSLVSPTIPADEVHNFLEGLGEVLELNRSTQRIGSWLSEFGKEVRQQSGSVIA